MKDSKTISKKQRVVYESIKRFIANGTIPTVREICEDTGLSSTSTVHSHLRTLERKGYISRDKKHRSLKLVGTESAITVPVFDKITSKESIDTLENISGYAAVLISVAADKELFALRMSGESMKDAGILDGDIVVCEKKDSARNGDVVVALAGEETTVKIFSEDDETEIFGRVISLYREF